MGRMKIESDQLYNWSAHDQERLLFIPAPEAPCAPSSTACPPARLAGLPHRTLQALRETRLPVRPGAGARSQVLPLRQSARTRARDGLRSLRVSPPGRSVPDQSAAGTRDPRSSLPDQPGTPSPEGEAVEPRGFRAPREDDVFHRRGPDGSLDRQHGGAGPFDTVAEDSFRRGDR